MIKETDYEDQDLVLFKPEDESTFPKPVLPVYKILIVDDDDEVHKITRLTLKNLVFDGHGVLFLSAYGLAEAKGVFNTHEDIAIVLIDVVMETSSAGLDLVQYIRDGLNNRNTRIILRTGQPGAAPEEKVIVDYDINDYKSKTELTAQKLFTSVIACIRSYRDIIQIDRNRRGLKKIIDSTSDLFDFQDKSLKEFLKGLLDQLAALHRLNGDQTALSGLMMMKDEAEFRVIAATGQYEPCLHQPAWGLMDPEVQDTIQEICKDNQDRLIFTDRYCAAYHKGYEDTESIIYMQLSTGAEQDLTRIFMNNISLALDNFILNRSIQVTQREIISTLSEIVEKRDMSTANHIKRVSEYAYIMGKNLGLDTEACNKMKIACMMHDVGKIGISDSILLKPAGLSAEEFEKIKEHSSIGHRILENSNLPIMKIAAEIALNHHERWDGNGYPNQLCERCIPLNARIIAILDVFDALTHKRIYKEAWTFEEAFDFIRSQSGRMFDPKLVDLFFELLDEIMAVWNAYPDEDVSVEEMVI